jgi:hypothetical protein
MNIGVVLLFASVVSLANGTPVDYLFTAQTDPNPILRAELLAIRQGYIGYADLLASGLTNIVDYTKNVTLASSVIGAEDVASVQAELLDEVITVQTYAGELMAAGLASGLELKTLDDYTSLYNSWDFVPLGITGWRSDAHFAQLRKTYFSSVIQKTIFLPTFVTAAAISSAARLQLVTDLAAGRFYHCDYAVALAGLVTSKSLGCNASYALFRQTDPLSTTSQMLPVGVWINGVWYTPSDGDAWMYAKLSANCVEVNFQPMYHFEARHIQTLPVWLAANRQLGPSHPVFNVIGPALDYGMALADVGFPGIFNAGTAWDAYSDVGSAAMHALINRDWAAIPWTSRYFRIDMEMRGLTTLGGLKWRDDTEIFASAANNRASSFLRIYYASDAAVLADTELQAWASEIVSMAGGRLYGFPSPIATRDELVAIVAHVLLNPTRHHIENFKAYKQAILVLPYAPWKLYCPIPISKSSVNESWIVQSCMPNLVQSQNTINFAAGFDRPFAPSQSLLYTPSTATTGTLDADSRTTLQSDLDMAHSMISSRPTSGTVLPMPLLDPILQHRSGFV